MSEEKAGKESESEQKNIGVERKMYERKSGGLGLKDRKGKRKGWRSGKVEL